MNDYYCKNCNNIVGKWNNEYEYYTIETYCYYIESKNINSLYFLNCKKCNKFVGVECYDVCENCFGKNEIFGEKNLFNFFLKYRKLKPKCIDFKFNCKICDKDTFRWQSWFFKELTFYKQ